LGKKQAPGLVNLPAFVRRYKEIGDFRPNLYLKGLSAGGVITPAAFETVRRSWLQLAAVKACLIKVQDIIAVKKSTFRSLSAPIAVNLRQSRNSSADGGHTPQRKRKASIKKTAQLVPSGNFLERQLWRQTMMYENFCPPASKKSPSRGWSEIPGENPSET
jgi:hypothetical protein